MLPARVERAENQLAASKIDRRAHAHGAWFERHTERATGKLVAPPARVERAENQLAASEIDRRAHAHGAWFEHHTERATGKLVAPPES